MTFVKQWALTVAVAAVIGAVIHMLSPSGRTGKIVKTAVSFFMLLSMLSPFAKSVDIPDFNIHVPETLSQPDMTEAVKRQMKTETEKKIREILEEYGIKPDGINIDINISTENVMTVEKIEITAREADGINIEKAEEKIKSEIGADVRIGVAD